MSTRISEHDVCITVKDYSFNFRERDESETMSHAPLRSLTRTQTSPERRAEQTPPEDANMGLFKAALVPPFTPLYLLLRPLSLSLPPILPLTSIPLSGGVDNIEIQSDTWGPSRVPPLLCSKSKHSLGNRTK